MRLSRMIAASVVAVLVVAGVVLARDAVAARRALLGVETQLQAVLDEAADRDVRNEATAAQSLAADAQARTDGPLWAVAGVVPWVGDQTTAVQQLVDAAAAASDLAVAAATVAAPLLAGDIDVPIVDGRVDLDELDRLLVGVDELPVAPLATSLDQLRSTDGGALVPELAAARQRVLRLGDRATSSLDVVADLRVVLPGLLGGEGPRTYFLAVQNSAEIRGTGGFLGFLATLGADDGRLAVGPVTSYDIAADLDEDEGVVARRNEFEDPSRFDDPVPRSDEMAARYDHVQVGGFLGNANVHPDLVETAPSLLALVERNADVELDGIVAVDPTALELLQRAIGPLDVPDPLAALAPGLPDPIPPGRIDEVLLTDVYQELGGSSPERKQYHAAVAAVATRSVFSGDWEPRRFVRQLVEAVRGRHIQVHSRDPEEQAALERLGVAGRLAPVAGEGDLVAVTANNAGGNKQDVLVGHRFDVDVTLGTPDLEAGTVSADRRVEVTVTNPLEPEGLDSYISGLWGQGAGAAGNLEARELSADNRTWVSVWSPVPSGLAGATDGDGESMGVATGEVGGVIGFDHHLLTPSASSASFSVDVVRSRAPVVRVDDDEVAYRLTLWRQAKAIPDAWDVDVAAPPGWRIERVDATGGGSGTGTGVDGEGVPLDWGSDGDSAWLRGTATEDVVLTVALSRA